MIMGSISDVSSAHGIRVGIQQYDIACLVLFAVGVHLIHIGLRNSTVSGIVGQQLPLSIQHDCFFTELQYQIRAERKGAGRAVEQAVARILRPQINLGSDVLSPQQSFRILFPSETRAQVPLRFRKMP